MADALTTFRDRRVLITGHTGFKGSWLAAVLHVLGAHVSGLSSATPPRGAWHDFGVGAFCDGHVADIRDRAAIAPILESTEPEILFHLAAQPLVRPGWRDPVTTFDTNVMGTVNVVDRALRTPSVRAIVVVTTDKVYENRERGHAFVEGDRLGGHDPYSASKAGAELALAPYRELARGADRPSALVSVRAGNVIGGGDWAEERLLPDIVRALERGGKVVLRRPGAIRPWQHVLDCLWGYLSVAAAMIDGDDVAPAYNFAPAEADWTVLDLAVRAVDAWGGSRDDIEVALDESSAESHTLRLDAGLARADLGWLPRWSVEKAIDETVAFYRATDPGAIGRSQIEDHLAR